MKKKAVDLTQENDYFSSRQDEGLLVMSFKGNAILRLTILKAKEIVLDFLESASSNPEIRAVLLLARPRKARREEYLSFYDMVSSGRLSKHDVLRMYRAIDQFILFILSSDLFFINADCGQIIPIFANIGLACDYRLVGENAVFQKPDLELGLAPKGGGAFFLNAMQGRGRAFEWMLSGKEITAREAVELGLVNRIIPVDTFQEEAIGAARQFASLPETSLRLAKRLSNYFIRDLKEYLEFENSELITALVQSGKCE